MFYEITLGTAKLITPESIYVNQQSIQNGMQKALLNTMIIWSIKSNAEVEIFFLLGIIFFYICLRF